VKQAAKEKLLGSAILLLLLFLLLFPLPWEGITLYYAVALALILTANNHPEVAVPLIAITIVQRFLIELEAFILAFDQ
jgi:hypothetical protein